VNGFLLRALAYVLLACALVAGTSGPGAWAREGTPRADVLSGVARADVLRGTPGADVLRGTARADVLRAGAGRDRVLARGGSDRVFGGHGPDRVFGGRGDDRISGGSGRDTLLGGRGDDRILGGPHRDLLIGGRGRDTLSAGGGPDRVIARDGRRDRIACGPGRDRAALDAADVIVGATAANPDGSCEEVTRTTGPAPDAFLLAAGDIAECPGGAEITARLLDDLPGTIAALGDTVYQRGTPAEYATCYEPTWGRHKARTRPAVGNHEYGTPGASGYFGYFGAAAGEPGKGWYSYELGAWHVIVLNSNCSEVGGCGPGSEQERWLRADLTAHPTRCTLAYWHHTRFSSGNAHGGSPIVAPFWRALRGHGAELVLSGHEHDYERFAPQDADGAADPGGIRQFVVGTGGADLREFANQPAPNSEVRLAGSFGVLSLRLENGAYEWRFVAQPGSPARDTGRQACH
jgi:RTX calcium-binding nonapeptide repeat (4 copies)/Calcineurin-like phosphoesterase